MSPIIHVHTSAPDAFFVNSFIIEGPKSLVLVDTQFVLSEARQLLKKMQALKKPLAAILITHPHPDHYNGLATILEAFPGTPVHATAATIAGIRDGAEPKRAYWTPIIGADYPQSFAIPDVVVADGQEARFDGIDLRFFDMGAAECADNTMIALPQLDAVIVSDIVYNRAHPWLAEGRSGLWLAALRKAKAIVDGANTLYAGHGAPGRATIIDDQIAYINDIAAMVAEGDVSEAGKAALRNRIISAHPGWQLETIVGMNIDSLAAERRAA